jgi:hypothetical protein
MLVKIIRMQDKKTAIHKTKSNAVKTDFTFMFEFAESKIM